MSCHSCTAIFTCVSPEPPQSQGAWQRHGPRPWAPQACHPGGASIVARVERDSGWRMQVRVQRAPVRVPLQKLSTFLYPSRCLDRACNRQGRAVVVSVVSHVQEGYRYTGSRGGGVGVAYFDRSDQYGLFKRSRDMQMRWLHRRKSGALRSLCFGRVCRRENWRSRGHCWKAYCAASRLQFLYRIRARTRCYAIVLRGGVAQLRVAARSACVPGEVADNRCCLLVCSRSGSRAGATTAAFKYIGPALYSLARRPGGLERT